MKIEAAILLGSLFIIQLIPSECASINEGTTSCKSSEFFDCNGRCIPKTWVNDGEEDCADGSDEGIIGALPKYARIPEWMQEPKTNTTRFKRVVGGKDAPEPIPWQVHVHFKRNGRKYSCGGTIINEDTILSAAHCYYPLETADYIRAGIKKVDSSKGQKIDVNAVIIHPFYDEFNNGEVAKFDNDIAILKLKEPLTLNADVLPARLPDSTLNPELKRTSAYVSGWGTVKSRAPGASGGHSSEDLKFVSVPILEISDCTNLNVLYSPTNITSNMICAGDLIDGGEDSCQGDSGGPMVIPYSNTDDTAIVYGIVSWGNGCAQQNGPGMYARVSNANSWILTNMNKPKTDGPAPTENIPAAIDAYYDDIMSNLGTSGRNLTVINQVFANDWRIIPDPSDWVKGNKFLLGAGVRDFLSVMMPNLKYERMHTYVINKTTVAVVSKIGATIGDVPPTLSEYPMFPGIEPNRLKGKSFSAMALDIHILDNGKIQRTWHAADWTLALDIMLETGRDVGSLDWPFIEKGETLKEVPQCIKDFYEKILSDSNGGGQNNKLLLKTMHRNAIVRPRMSSLGVVGIGGLKVVTRYLADVMPDIKYERQKTWIHEDKVVVLHKVSATNIKEPQRGFDEIPSFPGVDPKKLFGKKFETLGISIHRILDGKIKQTYFIDEWQFASAQMLSNTTAPDFDFNFL